MKTRHTNSANQNVTLSPLLEHGPDALDIHDIPHLAHASLVGLKISWHNPASGVTVKKAPDLFHTRGSKTDFIPKDATVTEATFELQFDDSSHTQIIKVRPPADVTLQLPSDHSRIDAWLHKRRFQVSKHVLQTAGAVLLAIASAIAPSLNDGDGDEDDVSSDHTLRA